MRHIENDDIRISVSAKGAELQSIVEKATGQEYMWSGDAAFWPKKSPVLFPVVGALKNNSYSFNHNQYSLQRHGFARKMDFQLAENSNDTLHFFIESTPETLEAYPFEFELHLIYFIRGNSLSVTYQVLNKGKENMFFSVGGHPAFRVPMFPRDDYTDYLLLFEKKEDANRWPIAPGGLIETQSLPFLQHSDCIPLHKDLFLKDAIVLKQLRSETVDLVSAKNQKGLSFNFSGFPYLGIWAAPGADFVCIEPWCGIADSVDTTQALVNKEGINELEPGAVFSRTWKVRPI